MRVTSVEGVSDILEDVDDEGFEEFKECEVPCDSEGTCMRCNATPHALRLGTLPACLPLRNPWLGSGSVPIAPAILMAALSLNPTKIWISWLRL
ncbi:unnamed protein product [Microthlaspi erraticum]|uniref:Uncharacterized protein n=1 Tax=Microthlaspi erraticum TaxID=1685480 RepID=A0A6D2KN62_9BRAS|nr:unnamed protein product [Microthlaspi erraticum]